MGLNLSRTNSVKYYSSNRISSLIGNGLMTFIDRRTQLSDFFDDDEVVFYNNLEINSKRLTIPHPGMIKREFVLIPLLEITNYRFNIPKYGKLVHYLKRDF